MEITQVFSQSTSPSPTLSPSIVSKYGNHPSILPIPFPLPKPLPISSVKLWKSTQVFSLSPFPLPNPLPIYSVKVWKSPKYSTYPHPPPPPTIYQSIVLKYGNHPSILPNPLPLPKHLQIYSVKVWKSPKDSPNPPPHPQPSHHL